ncbi:serine/threonine protein kinase [Striga asiatica]|uniref:Serine/threonine protein kinase n=1 Tax=Striga asiatica TaxID=4170 RepID=A0A5A7Q6Z6_STRAF|nr:serine/threonine protein kinase [Striga asiatica]
MTTIFGGHRPRQTVYKVRKKKTIEYYAIKSVDKSHRSKVLHEVKILHALDNSNVLKFYTWYETSTHFCLILEYCDGGDLMTVLQEDGKLQEDSVHDLAHDLVKALHYHKQNMELPVTWLQNCSKMDEFIRMRLILGSRLCSEFTHLAKLILSGATPALPGTPTPPFVNLVNSLLVKDPSERIQWPELCNHAFWKTKIVPLTLPPQPAFTNTIEMLSEPHLTETPIHDDSKPHEQSVTPPSACPQLKTPRYKEVSRRALDFDATKSSSDLSDVLWHPSDLSVRPIMPSRKFEKGSDAVPSLPFHTFPQLDFAKLPKDRLDAIYNRIVSIMNGNINGDNQNVIRYLEMLRTNADAANILTNWPIMLLLVKMLRQYKALALRVQLSSLIGLLIRHSTFIGDNLANSDILGALTDGLKRQTGKSKKESPSKDSRPSSSWQLYALRTIENVSSHGGYLATRFTSQGVISNLCYIFRATGKQESIRLTAGSCLVRYQETSAQENCLMSFYGKPTRAVNLLEPLIEDNNLVSSLLSLIEQGSEVLKGKALLFVALLSKNLERCPSQFFCNRKFLSAVDSLAKDKDQYVQHCLAAFVHAVVSTSRLVVHLLLVNSSFKKSVMPPEVLQLVANLLKLAELPFQGSDDFQIDLMRILDSVSTEVDNNPTIFIHQVLHSVTALYKGNKDADARFLCFKILFDIMVHFLIRLLTEPLEDEQRLQDLKTVSNVNFLPLYPSFMEDEDPIPMRLRNCLECSSSLITSKSQR